MSTIAISDPARLLRCSRLFQRDFTEAWVAGQSDDALVRALRNPERLQRLRRWARTGFCTLDQRLIEALLGAGLSWGGQWRSSKDFMHFDLP